MIINHKAQDTLHKTTLKADKELKSNNMQKNLSNKYSKDNKVKSKRTIEIYYWIIKTGNKHRNNKMIICVSNNMQLS